MKNLTIILKGFIIGSSMSVPGVSGGTMAILLGIYDKLIGAVSNFFKNIKENAFFLGKVCLGGILGLCSLAFLIEALLGRFPIQVCSFFLGAVIGGIPALLNKTREEKFTFSSFIYFVAGLAIVIGITFMPKGMITISNGFSIGNLIMWLITGVIVALALVLPGISTSHMLVVLGMYDITLNAITDFNIPFLLILGVATIVGIFLITKPLEWIMNKYTHKTYCAIIGFVAGSTVSIFKDKIIPAAPDYSGVYSWAVIILVSIVTFILGIIAINYLSKFSSDN